MMLSNFPDSGISNKFVSLVKFCDHHITSEYISWLNDEEIVKHSNQRFFKHDAHSSATYLSSFTNTSNLFLAVINQSSNKMIGTMTAYIDENHNTADLGILIGEKSTWGNGFGFYSWSLLLEWLLEHQKIRKVTAGTNSENIGMLKIFQKSNMSHECTRKAQELINGKETDIYLFCRFNQ